MDSRAIALQESTKATNLTRWPDERSDVPPIRENDRAFYREWLESSGFLAASDPQKWEAICRTWISFLSATSPMPNLTLAPLHKVAIGDPNGQSVIFEPRGLECQEMQARRFMMDQQMRRCIEEALWWVLDDLEIRSERWPTEARIILNQLGSTSECKAFESLVAKVNLEKRRRANSFWMGLVCFLVYALEEDALEEMGLEVSEDIWDDIFDVTEAESDGEPGGVESAVMELLMHIVTDPRPTPRSNPLLWWVGVLVHSSLQVGADDYISRGRFVLNILPMDMDIQARLESLVHYAKVVVLDLTVRTWEPNEVRRREVISSIGKVDNKWIYSDDDRPAAGADSQDCSSVAWQDMLKHLRSQCKKYLGEWKGKAVGQVTSLLHQRGQL